jgi:hypothetical protein
MVSRFVGNPNSTIGNMLKKSMSGIKPTTAPPQDLQKTTKQTDDLLADLEKLSSPGEKLERNQFINELLESVPEEKKDEGSVDLLNESISEVEQDQEPATDEQVGLMSQVTSQVIDQATDTLNPQNPVGSAGSKESLDSVSLDQIAVDAARSAQQVEVEPTPEIPPEVESYLQKVEDHSETAPEEIVIADGSNTQPNDHNYPSQPVVVLPITPEIEKKGARKNPRFSVRWLVEWSKKIMKVFSGKVIYRIEEKDES